jgi:hypothetical protein
MSNTPTGHRATNSSAAEPVMLEGGVDDDDDDDDDVDDDGSTISGIVRYAAVATGDHFACAAPVPFSQCNSTFFVFLRDRVKRRV